ncbi:hypothetical protein [Ruminiclostridium cellobioparum]|uniref:hypothetical protein n=1 Tax=Ruminiclostridium cellobioparum TaxID=29355 RepID=UPI00047F46B2|nr:hypothetical protein [Ruminiclostridium cellobioparum]
MEITVNVNVSAPELSSALNNLALAMGGRAITSAESTKDEAKKATNSKADKKEKEKPQKDPEPEKTDEPVVITLEEVRGKLAELTRAGKPVKELINKFGASKLSEIPPEKFAEVLKEAEGL